jgi:hypothetical protein
MHHTTDLRNADRAGLARSALGAFLATDLRGDLAPTDPVDVVRAWENAVRTGADKAALVELIADVLHLADRLDFRPSEVTCLAQEHYYGEILEEQ